AETAKPATPTAAPSTAKAPSAPAKPEGTEPSADEGSSATIAYQSGLQLLLKGDPKKALTAFQRAVELDPKMAQAHYELGKLQFHLSSQNVGSYMRDHDILDQSIAALTKARDLEPNNDDYWYWLGRAQFLKKDSADALAAFTKAVTLNPKHAGAWKALGIAPVDASQTEQAKEGFQHPIASAP